MTQRLFITLGSRRRKDRVLLELPCDQPIQGLIPDLIQVIGWKELADVPRNAFYLETEEGERLQDSRTLKDAGISSSDLLFLSHPDAQDDLGTPTAQKEDLQGLEIRTDADGCAADFSSDTMEILRQPRLMGPGGLAFLLSPSPVSIGRSGKGAAPDIDLAEWDAKMIISRRHAVIEKIADGLVIKPEKTTNGTFLNGVEVPEGESRVLHDGDRIHFGFKGLELIYQAAGK